ncbi:MAG: hypothetical protein VXW87_00510 [Pseudomonadota bacterium]|nr:hypothetical protein [Pseudomonadota bacterium]
MEPTTIVVIILLTLSFIWAISFYIWGKKEDNKSSSKPKYDYPRHAGAGAGRETAQAQPNYQKTSGFTTNEVRQPAPRVIEPPNHSVGEQPESYNEKGIQEQASKV